MSNIRFSDNMCGVKYSNQFRLSWLSLWSGFKQSGIVTAATLCGRGRTSGWIAWFYVGCDSFGLPLRTRICNHILPRGYPVGDAKLAVTVQSPGNLLSKTRRPCESRNPESPRNGNRQHCKHFPDTGFHRSRLPSFARVVIASEARQSRQGNGRRHGNEIATSLRSSR